MTLFEIIAPPIIGGIIGYSTNMIAIKMLFRPRHPVMIGRFQLPFTPGIVPKRKDMLAGVLGRAVAEQFMDLDDLESIFTSDSFKTAVSERIMVLLNEPETHLTFLDPDKTPQSKLLKQLRDELCIRIQAAFLKTDLKQIITEQYGRIMHERFGEGIISKVLNETTFSVIVDPLVNYIERDVLENGRDLFMPVIDDELRELAREPISNILDQIEPDKDALRALIGNVYAGFMENHVRPIVESIDIAGMITDKVRQMDATDVESLTLTVVSRELRYVILLGGLIGALIGAVNIFI